MEAPQFDGKILTLGTATAAAEQVEGFREHFSPWTGRAWVEVSGPGWTLPIESGYGAIRADLRRWFPDRPFQSDWSDGRFPSARFGLPADLMFALALGVTAALSMGVAWAAGPAAGLAILAVAFWPLVRLRDAVAIRPEGIRTGPPWAELIPWREANGVQCRITGRAARIWVRATAGSGTATVPAVLVPALRARIHRLGGLELVEASEGIDARYERWQAPATGIPWGVLVGTAVAAAIAPSPWVPLVAGLLSMAGVALLGAAVEARATGWGAGAILWSSGVYAVVLAALAVGIWL